MNLVVNILIKLLILISSVSNEQSPSISGKWFASEMDNSTIQFEIGDDGILIGKVIDSDVAEYIGKTIFEKGIYDDEKQTWEGTAYALKRNITIRGSLSLVDPNQLKLVGRKYFLTKTFYMIRK